MTSGLFPHRSSLKEVIIGMATTKAAIPFSGTPAQQAQLEKVIEAHKDQKGALMPVLQGAQEIYGYLPVEVQKMVSDGLGIPLEEIYGVATFYSQFTLVPKGQYKIFNKLSEKLGIASGGCTPDGRFSLDACRCIGACGLAPVLTVNDEVYGRLTVDDVDDILAKYGA